MSYLSFVHVAEGLKPEKVDRPVWDSQVYEKACIDLGGREHRLRTAIYNMDLMPKADPEKYCRRRLDRGRLRHSPQVDGGLLRRRWACADQRHPR